ncbi:MAG TPA: serine/threonine-protein kinase [Vicinamibacterales bacterium]
MRPAGVPAGTGEPVAVLGAYHLLERIGAGGLGEIYRARDVVHGRTVAVRRIPSALASDPARSAAFEKACQAVAAVSHPNVALLYKWERTDGELLVSHEFAPGQTLAQLGGGALNPRRAVEIALEIALGLEALHAAGLVHGDLRPGNVVVTPKGHVKLLDAGLAAFTGSGALRAGAAGRIGKLPPTSRHVLAYMSPEEALGERCGAQSDLFSLGAILYELLTGRSAFERVTADETLLAVVQTSPDDIEAVAQPLAGILRRALAKPLDRRYRTAVQMAGELRAVQELLAADTPPEPAAGSGVPRWLWWVAAMAAGGLGVAGWLTL